MEIFLWILSLLGAFSIMEFMAWFTHKYIMHGFLWYLHEDHHKKNVLGANVECHHEGPDPNIRSVTDSPERGLSQCDQDFIPQ